MIETAGSYEKAKWDDKAEGRSPCRVSAGRSCCGISGLRNQTFSCETLQGGQ